MSIKQKLVWETYFAIILFFAVQKVYLLLSSDSPQYLYYLIARSFDPRFYFDYYAHILHVLLSLIHCLPLFLYIHRIKFLNPTIWRFLFILRCIFEVTGHAYTKNVLISFFHVNPKIVIISFIAAALPHIPSYLVCYWYAFKVKDKW